MDNLEKSNLETFSNEEKEQIIELKRSRGRPKLNKPVIIEPKRDIDKEIKDLQEEYKILEKQLKENIEKQVNIRKETKVRNTTVYLS